MGEREVEIYLVIMAALVLVLIIGIIFYIFQFRQRLMMHRVEKDNLIKQHQLDILHAKVESHKDTSAHIGREIHDSVAQKITLASIYLQKLLFDRQPDREAELNMINNILSNSLQELRRLSRDLTEDSLGSLSLQELISEECRNIRQSGVCQVQFDAKELPDIPVRIKTSLLRIVQEFVQNSLKHASCQNILIQIDLMNGNIELELRDDGRGFDLNRYRSNGIGLESIRRRAEFIEASCEMASTLGQGTSCHIVCPIIKPENDVI